MIALPQHGLVFLAMTKCASTAIEAVLEPHGQIVTRGAPALKHMHYRGFEKFVQPMLRRTGHPRHSYEVVCLFREPVDWLHSWWRYRSRPELRRRGSSPHDNYTGDLPFAAFCDAYVDGSDPRAASVGRQANFVRDRDGEVGVDRIFRYEDLPVFVDFLSDRVGQRLSLDAVNVSPPATLRLPAATRSALREHLAPEYAIYDDIDTTHDRPVAWTARG
jgi:hypothetical protein